MTLDALRTLLDGSTLARRPEQAHAVWVVSPRWREHDTADVLLAHLVRALAATDLGLYLEADPSVAAADLGAVRVRAAAVRPGTWRLAADSAPEALPRAPLHAEGNYALYAAATPPAGGLPSGLPWWGPGRWSGRAARLVDGLRAVGVAAAVAVHADASDWLAVIAGESVAPPSSAA